MTVVLDSTSATYTPTLDTYESVPDSGTSTPKQRPWQGKVARWAIAATMLATQGTSIFAEMPSNAVQVNESSVEPGGQGFVLAHKPDATTMNGVIKKPSLDTLFEFRGGPAVSSFVQDNPFLSDILFDAYLSIPKRFGGKPSLALEVFINPEEIGQDHLRLLIKTALPVEEALDRLAQLDEQWLYGILPAIQNKMIVDVELV